MSFRWATLKDQRQDRRGRDEAERRQHQAPNDLPS
jgi:hypothetical protein